MWFERDYCDGCCLLCVSLLIGLLVGLLVAASLFVCSDAPICVLLCLLDCVVCLF